MFSKDDFRKKSRDAVHVNLDLPNITSWDRPIIFEANKEKDDGSDDSTKEARENNRIILPYILSSLFGTVLEDTVTHLRVLVETSNKITLTKMKTDRALFLRQKYGVMEQENVDELDGIDQRNLDCTEYKINKLESDRNSVVDTIKRTYVDLCVNKSFQPLEDKVDAILAVKNYREALADEENKNKAHRRELARQLRQQRNHNKSLVYDAEGNIDKLSALVEDATLISECRGRYTVNWDRARTEQHIQSLHETLSDYSSSVEYWKQKTDQEHKVHLEIDLITKMAIQETLQRTEDLMNTFDIDMDSVDVKIQIQKNDFQNMKEKRIYLQKKIASQDKMMKDWLFYKDERERARQYRVTMTKSAIVVQAWWRGMLVRLRLGPYKPVQKHGRGRKRK